MKQNIKYNKHFTAKNFLFEINKIIFLSSYAPCMYK